MQMRARIRRTRWGVVQVRVRCADRWACADGRVTQRTGAYVRITARARACTRVRARHARGSRCGTCDVRVTQNTARYTRTCACVCVARETHMGARARYMRVTGTRVHVRA